MKKRLTIFLLLFISVNFSFSQEEAQKPTVMKPVYFDISPPLRDMVQKSDVIFDQSWKEGIVINKLNTLSNDRSITDAIVEDQVRQSTFGHIQTDTTIQNFEGVASTMYFPPDTDGDVGPNHYFQATNVRFAIYDKNGNKLMGPTNNSVIFSGLPNNSNDGDAILLYDENADRWLFSQFSLPNYPNGPFYENVAISQTADPTGSWYRYQYTFTDMPDYPKLAVWVDGYYMTIRRFASGSGNWLGPSAVALDRTKMLAGNPAAVMVMFNLPSSSEGPQSADCDSDFPPAGTPCPVAILTSTATASVRLYDFHTDWVTPANSTFNLAYTIPITPFSYFGNTNNITQKGTSQKLANMSGKRIMFRMPFRKFSTHWSMLLNTTVNLSNIAGIRWMELRNVAGVWSLYQEGTFAPADANHRWMGSIAMDSIGNIALGYSISSTSMYPSIRYTGRLNGDPLGIMTIAEKGIMNGGGSQTATEGRWGDYSAMSADPSVIGKFWYTQQYFLTTSSSSWKTRIASFSFSNIFSTVTSAAPNPVCLGDSTQLYVAPNGGSGTYTYSWSSIPAGFASTLQNPKAAPTEITKYIAATSDGTTTRHDTVQVNLGYKPTISAGADTIVCWYVTSIELHGTATNYKQFGWSTTGSGTFSSITTLETTYFPSLNDKIAGSVDLKLVANSNPPCSGNVTSTKHVVFDACTGIAAQNITETGLTIRPNPAHGTVAITMSGLINNPAMLTITSTDGKIFLSEIVEAASKPVLKQLDISGYSKGVYVVQLKTGKQVITEKMIVQ
jgi:hypothetical protein